MSCFSANCVCKLYSRFKDMVKIYVSDAVKQSFKGWPLSFTLI